MSDSSENLGGDSDSDQDLFDESRRRQNRQRAREEAIYGVFYDDDNHDSYDRRSGGRDRRRRDDGGMNIAPQFVKGKTTKDEDLEREDDKYDDIFESQEDSKDKILGEEEKEEEETEEEKAQDEEERRKEEAANDYFMTLLKRGKGEKSRQPMSSSSNIFRADRYEETVSKTPAPSAGLGFHSGSAGLGFTPSSQRDHMTTDSTNKASMFAAASGLGIGSSAPGLGMPTAFGAGNAPQQEAKPAFVKDPNIGSWEKHTKGIGMKLLAKMGYTGSGGLGSTRRKKKTVVDEKSGEKIEVEATAKTGISRPVEVVVRPNNLGLGYGNFKEATKLKTNQQIEAEVRGIDLKKKKEEDEAKSRFTSVQSSGQPQGASSALPSVKDLMQQKAWKRGAKQSQKSRKKARRTIIPYTELLEKQGSQPSIIIDMRGPSSTAAASDEQGKPTEVPLAEELLHNLSLLLNTYENKVHSGSHFVRSTKQKVESLESDIASMEKRQEENRIRIKKLKKVLESLDQIEAIIQKPVSGNGSGTADVATVQSLVRELQDSFTPDERVKLHFFDVLAPSLLEPVIQTRLEHWDPLKTDAKSNNETMEMVVSFCKSYPTSSAEDSASKLVMARTIFTNFLLPRVKGVLESQRWDPINDVETGLQLYEGLCHVADTASPPLQKQRIGPQNGEDQIFPSEDPDTIDHSQELKDLVQEEIINKTVYFRLARALSLWKPQLDESGTSLLDRPSLWILPWIPHLDHRSVLPTLLADCKRKLKTAMSVLQKGIGPDDVFCAAALQAIRPWCKVFPIETVKSLASTSFMLRVANSVGAAASAALPKNISGMEWKLVDMALEMYSIGLLSDKELLSTIEGELLSRWAAHLQALLYRDPAAWNDAAGVYLEWRGHLFSPETSSNANKCLQQDKMVCTVFYSVLLMIQAAHDCNKDLLDDLKPTSTSSRAVLARRTREEREQAQEELYRMEASGVATGSGLQDPAVEARVRAAQRNNGHTPTFREVVEDFARDNDVLFQPRMGHNSTKDGKQVFLFGDISIYLDSDVVFAYRNSEWKPTSLTQLGMMQKAKS